MKEIVEKASVVEGARRARARALVVPREHGAWGLLLVPLFTGVAVGARSADRLWPLLVFVISALSLFWLRTPVESLLASGPVVARTREERRLALTASAVLAVVSVVCLTALLWRGRNRDLLVIGTVAALAFALQTALRKIGRRMRMASQLVGAIGLTATAPAAYYLATGRLGGDGVVLWSANWLFAWNQIHFVQLRIHAARAGGFTDRIVQGTPFLLSQIFLLFVLVLASIRHEVPPLVIVAFAPALYRGTRWFFQEAQALDVKKLGWSEMKHGVAFGILLIIGFLVH